MKILEQPEISGLSLPASTSILKLWSVAQTWEFRRRHRTNGTDSEVSCAVLCCSYCCYGIPTSHLRSVGGWRRRPPLATRSRPRRSTKTTRGAPRTSPSCSASSRLSTPPAMASWMATCVPCGRCFPAAEVEVLRQQRAHPDRQRCSVVPIDLNKGNLMHSNCIEHGCSTKHVKCSNRS